MNPFAALSAHPAATTLAIELLAVCLFGSYAMRRLVPAGSGFSGIPARLLFWGLVMPGVVAHEAAHYLACKLTLTPVERFVPFYPHGEKGRIVLGYVRSRPRGPLTALLVGMAPVVLNPLLVTLSAWLLTPLGPADLLQLSARPHHVTAALAHFARLEPFRFVCWAYLAWSLALAGCPSRSDLAALPAAAALTALVGWGVATLVPAPSAAWLSGVGGAVGTAVGSATLAGSGAAGGLAVAVDFASAAFALPAVVAVLAASGSWALSAVAGRKEA